MSCWSERWCPPGSSEQPLRPWAAAYSSSLTVGGTCSSPCAWSSSSAVCGPRPAAAVVEVERAAARRRWPRRPAKRSGLVAPHALRSSSSGAGQMATTAQIEVARGRVQGEEASHARSAQGHRRTCAPRRRSTMASTSSTAPGPKAPSERPCPRASIGQRGHALVAASAREVEVALLRRARAVEHHHAHLGLAPRGGTARSERPLLVPSSGGAGGRAS